MVCGSWPQGNWGDTTVSYFAAAVVRDKDGWTADEIDLAGVADVDEVAERLRDVNPDADVSLLFVESDDAYLVILRLDEGEDLRVFGSDSTFAEESRLGALLIGDVDAPALEVGAAASDAADAEESEGIAPGDTDIDPVGDADILADLGISANRLLSLVARDGMLPSDVTAEVCRVLGADEQVEELREA